MEGRQRGGEGLRVRLVALDAFDHEAEGGEQAAQAGVGHELAEKGLCIDGALKQVGQRLLVDQQERVFLQVGRCVGFGDAGEVRGVSAEFFGERRRGAVGFLGDLCVDDSDKDVVVLRECGIERVACALPGQVLCEHAAGVGGDAEALPGDGEREGREHHGNDEDQQPVGGAIADEARKRGARGGRHVHGEASIIGPARQLAGVDATAPDA